jgi:signal transduction histidine kinase/CheY-like chemotaxis protein
LNSQPPANTTQRSAVIAAAITAAIAVAVLVGWALKIEVLKGFGRGLPAMNPMTACCLLAASAALALLRPRDAGTTRRRLAYLLAGIVTAAGTLKLVAIVSGWSIPFDQWLWPGELGRADGPPVRIPIRTALNLVLAGSGLLLLDVQTRRGRRPAELLSAGCAIIAFLALIAYSYGIVVYYRTSTYVPMSFPGAIAFFVLGIGILFARPDKGAVAIIASDTAGGLLARLLLPLALLLPLLLGALRRKGESAGWFSSDLGVALFATFFIVFFLVAIWWTTRLLFRSDMQRKAAEERVRQANAELEQRVAERTAELHKLNEELRQASKAKDDFMSVLSHELRTPLTPALAAASYLADNVGTVPSAEFGGELDVIRRNIQLEARLIDDLLDLTRISRGKIELTREHVDAHRLIREAAQMAANDIAQKQLTVSTTLAAEQHHICADAIRIQQVFWNLINNAVKFTGAGGTIAIATANDELGRFQFRITDTGIGIEPERKAALFKAFEQGERSVTRQFGGLGLGLAIAKSLVELHQGRIDVESGGRTQGASFTVTLDVSRTQPDEQRSGATGTESRRRPLRILVVEDHGDTRRTLARLLTHFGHEISVADCVQAALDAFNPQKFDAVLSDIGLPDGTGYEVMSEVRRQQAESKGSALTGIALTGFGMDEDIRRSKEAGFDYHLTKPIDFAQLRTVLGQIRA